MEPGHLLHPALTRPSSAVARRLKSRHPFVPAAQQLISFSDNNIRVAHGADQQWNSEWADNLTCLPNFIPDTDTHPPEWPSQNVLGSGLTASAPVLDVSAPACTNGVWPPLQPVECGTGQTVSHVVLQCPIRRLPYGLHGMTVLDDATNEWLLNTCPEI